MDYKNGKVRLQDSRCGRFGMPLKVPSSVTVYCPESECNDMCLSLRLFQSVPDVATIEKCSINNLLIFRPELLQNACSDGYYRMGHSYYLYARYPSSVCFSIQIFPKPVPVQDVVETVVQTYCGGKIMTLNRELDMYMFMRLSQEMKLTDGNLCLFGLTSNNIIEYADWESIDLSRVDFKNFKWDNSMNHSRVLSSGERSYLAVNPNGLWTWATDTVSCVVCTLDIGLYEDPQLLLSYNYLEKMPELVVTFHHNLFRESSFDRGFICFADIDKTYVSNLTIFPVVYAKDHYFIENAGLGQYWCAGNTIYTDILLSRSIDTNGTVFAFEILRKCPSECHFNETGDLNQFVSYFNEKCKFVKVLLSAVVHNETSQFDTEYTFVVHLTLALQDDNIIDLDTNLVNLTHLQVETVYIYEQIIAMITADSRVEQMNEKVVPIASNELYIRSTTSTAYCLHKSTVSLDAIIWQMAHIGEMVPTSSLCPPGENDLKRYCSLDTIYGTFWNEVVQAPHCSSIVSESLLKLYENFKDSPQEIVDLKTILQDNVQVLLPIDVFLTSRIMQKVATVSLDSLENILSIFNSLMMVDEKFLKMSASLNSTNILLESLDNILLSMHINAIFKDGNVSIHSPLIKTFVLHPPVGGGVSGIALYRPHMAAASDHNFTNYSTQYVDSNESIDQIFSNWNMDNDLVVGSYLPADMLDTLQNVSVAILVFFNDKLFQAIEDHSNTYFKTNGKIISMTIFEFDKTSRLPSKLPIIFETNRVDNSTCGYWNYVSDAWSSDGCNLRRVNDFQHLAVCECTHLTHFGYLVDSNRNEILKINERALTIITITGSSFSLFGSLGIFITAATFPNWRNKLSSKILINFTATIALQMCLMIVTNVDSIATATIVCVAMGSTLHYSILVTHFWMLIIAYFQFKRYIVVFNFPVSHLLLKSVIFGWLLPLLPVAAVLGSDYSLYLPVNKSEVKFCYPTGAALNFGVLAPIGLIFAINLIVYVSVLVSLKRGFSKSSNMAEAAKLDARLSKIRLLAFLFFTLGLTWIFAFLSKVRPNNCYLVFTYLFCITATVQGLVLFLYFIILDSFVRSLWLEYFKKISGREKTHHKASSIQ